MSDSDLISALKKRIEFDVDAAKTRAWQVFGFMEEPAHPTDKENFITTYMVEQSRWQSEQLKPVLLAMVECVEKSVDAEYWLRHAKYQTLEAEHAACKAWANMAKALARLKEAVSGEGE